MATIKYMLQSKKDNVQVYLRLSSGRNIYLKVKTGLTTNFKDWSIAKGKAKPNSTELKNLNTELTKLENFVFNKLNDTPNDEVVKDWLTYNVDLYFGRVTENKKTNIVTDWINDYINKAPTFRNQKGSIGLSKNRIENLKGFRSIYIEFEKKTKKVFKVKDIDFNFRDLFLDYLLNKKHYSKSYALKKLSDLKTICFNAELYGVETNPQLRKIATGKEKKELPQYLTLVELKKIKQLHLVSDRLINARKWLILGCSIGQRGNDLLSITKDNFVKRGKLLVIELQQQKTDKHVTIPVLNDTKEIYNSGLPFKIALQNFNVYIKELCKLAGIDEIVKNGSKICMVNSKGKEIEKDNNGKYKSKGVKRTVKGDYKKYELITSHTCRRSFATNNYGILPTALIMQITAHSTEKTFLNYIGKNALDYATQIADFYKLQELKEPKEPKFKIIKKASNQ